MPAFQCESCKKIFNLKTDLERHKNKKTPCISVEEIIKQELTKNTPLPQNKDDINKIKTNLL